MSFGSVFQSAGVVQEKERSPHDLSVDRSVMHRIQMSAEDQSCLEGV